MSSELLKIPRIAWPTLLLAAVALATWMTTLVLAQAGLISFGWALLGVSVAAYLSFTPMHDASHRSVGRSKTLNSIVGRIAALPLAAPYTAFRVMHLEHHRHTNDPVKDPDVWSGTGSAWTLPFRWVSQELHYYVRYARAWPSRPRLEAWETLLTAVLIWISIAALLVAGLWQLALLWVLGSRIAIGVLAFSFDYLPHRPHRITAAAHRYLATAIFRERWLTPILICQNYHLVHHLWPGVPFYRYPAVWSERREEVLAAGARETSVWDRLPATVPPASPEPLAPASP